MILGAVVLYGIDYSRWLAGVRPDGVSTYADYLERMPPPDSLAVFSTADGSYLEVRGQAASSWWRLPSGPPAYVFDETGQLVDWSSDIGDDQGYQTRWQPYRRERNAVSLSEATEWLRSRRPK